MFKYYPGAPICLITVKKPLNCQECGVIGKCTENKIRKLADYKNIKKVDIKLTV